MNTQPITRVDLEKVGQSSVIVRSWRAGWNRDDAGAPDVEDFIESGSIPALLAEYEKQGFTVEMAHAGVGRALRGEITRVDFVREHDGWLVKKFPIGWSAKTRPLTTETKPADFDLESALAWCQSHGWTVYRWDGGARAWKGQPKPIRDRATILTMRRKLTESLWKGESDNCSHFDLAFYF